MILQKATFLTWFRQLTAPDRTLWVQTGISRWCGDQDTPSEKIDAFHPLVLKEDIPLSDQLYSDFLELSGGAPPLFKQAVGSAMEAWSAVDGPEAFGELAAIAGKLGVAGFAEFLDRMVPTARPFAASTSDLRRAILKNCAKGAAAHPALAIGSTLLGSINRLRGDFRKTYSSNGLPEWSPVNALPLIETLVERKPHTFASAFTAFKEDFENYCAEHTRVANAFFSRISEYLSLTTLRDLIVSLPEDDDWLLEYLVRSAGEGIGEVQQKPWNHPLFAEWRTRSSLYLSMAPTRRVRDERLSGIVLAFTDDEARVERAGPLKFFIDTLGARPDPERDLQEETGDEDEPINFEAAKLALLGRR